MGIFKKSLSLTLAALTMTAAIPLHSLPGADRAAAFDNSGVKITQLKVNYCENPVAVDTKPYFSWRMESDEAGQRQTAYQIIVKDESEKTVWDSKKTESDVSLNIKYEGEALSPSTKYTWTVTVWDKDGVPVLPESPATFETGLLNASAWDNAEWLKAPDSADDFEHYTIECDMTFLNDAVGIVFAAKDSSNFLMWQFNTNTNASGEKRDLYLRPHFWVNSNVTVDQININDMLTEADIKNVKRHIKLDVSNSEIKTYVDSRLINTYPYAGAVRGDIGFRACHDNIADEQGLLDNIIYTVYDKNGAETLLSCDFNSGENPFEDGTVTDGQLFIGQPMNKTAVSTAGIKSGISMFRKEFTAASEENPAASIKSVRLYATALGVYELYYNGKRVGRKTPDGATVYDELKPGWTDYNKRVLYDAYDLTEYTAPSGGNALLAMVSSGWWNGKISKDTYGNSNRAAFKAKLIITYSDGTTAAKEINTDKSWKCVIGGPVRAADIYDGEIYDARLQSDAPLGADFNDSEWKIPDISGDFKGRIEANPGTYVRVKEDLTQYPKTVVIYDSITADGSDYGKINPSRQTEYDGSGDISEPIAVKQGETAVIDFGQNQVGRPVFTLNAAAGTRVTIRFAEMLNDSGKKSRGNDGPAGSLYTTNYRSAKSTNTYFASGKPDETYKALFTFFGYRYISITADRDVTVKKLRAEVIGSDTKETGSIVTSNESVNKLISNITWGQRGNYLSVATDCPQRDERLGWSGDTEFFIGAATYNADAASFFNKWASDCSDSQLSNGAYTDTIPASYANGSGNTAWADAGIIVPYVNYVMYNNTELIEKHYPSMQKYMAFLSTRGYLGANPGFGDWLSYEHTDPSYISMAYYAYTARLMSEMARAIDKSADCERYEKLYQTIKQKFIAKYVNADGTLKIKTQTSYLLALKIQLLPDEDAHERAAEALVKKIKANSGRLSTGFVGTSTIAQTLGACEKNNAAYTLLLQRGNPSWLYSVDQGATTIWERWNSYTKETGFGDATMNSFNHYSFGAVEEWMYRYMAGIEADGSAPGFKKFILQPTPDTRQPDEIPSDQSKITAVSASYNSMYGEITSEWSTADGVFDYKATVPANTCAQLKFPTLGENAVSVIINGVEVNLRGKNAGDALADGVTYIGREGKTLLLSLQPGSYDIKEGRSQLFPVTGITLDRSKLSLNIGEAYKLSASFEPADTTDSTELSFISSASHIASVGKDGTITAVSAGSAVITAALDKNPLIKAACTVTVRAENNGISVNKLSLSGRKKLAVGKKAKLKVKTYPENASDKRISFISSAKSVITVSEDGTMTAKSPGKAIITALANGGASGSVAVTVLPRAPRIKKVKRLSPSSVRITLSKSKPRKGTKYEYYVKKGGKKYKRFALSEKSSATLKNLSKAVKYKFKARAVTLKKGKKYYSAFSKAAARR